MSVTKKYSKHGVLLGIEAGGYGLGGALVAATDGFEVSETPSPEHSYQYDGVVEGRFAGTGGSVPNVAKYGRTGRVPLSHLLRLPGAAYSASVIPSIHRLLRLHGMSAAVVTTGGAEKWTYTPFTDGTWESGVSEVYIAGEKETFRGAYVPEVEFGIQSAGPVRVNASLQGTTPEPSDAAVPAITYPMATPDKLVRGAGAIVRLTLSAVDFNFRLIEATVKLRREIEDRNLIGTFAADHAGFQLGGYACEVEAVLEATALQSTPYHAATQIDPYRLAGEATLLTGLVQIGTAQYKRLKISGTQFQILSAQRERAGDIARWGVTCRFHPTTPAADDAYTIVAD